MVARGVLRDLLGVYLGILPGEVRFAYRAFGKPEVSPEVGGSLRFNLSHSADLALSGITWDARIGVDLEYIRPQPEYLEIARSFFSATEVFFFSSRRRHTRSTRDWSSDVCSSDLVYKPLVGILLVIRPENRKRLVLLLLCLQLSGINVQLQRHCLRKRLVADSTGVFLAAERIENERLGYKVLESFFVLNGLVFVLKCLVEVDVTVEQVVRGVIPSVPTVLSQSSKLPVEVLGHQFFRVHAHSERHCDPFPGQRDHTGIGLDLGKVVGQSFMEIGRLRFYGYSQGVFCLVVGEASPRS